MFEAHKWYAISLGSRGEFQGVKEKILDGFEFKKHIDAAAELNPGDHITQHLLGRFCYEVSQVCFDNFNTFKLFVKTRNNGYRDMILYAYL